MKKYFIYACEQQYGGYHGMETYGVFEFSDDWTEDEIWTEYVPEMSFEVMNSYDEIMDSLESFLDKDEFWSGEDYENAVLDLMDDNVDGYVCRIRDDVTESVAELDSLACNLGPELFKERYCVKEVY